jgi:hypothetical protein
MSIDEPIFKILYRKLSPEPEDEDMTFHNIIHQATFMEKYKLRRNITKEEILLRFNYNLQKTIKRLLVGG